MKDGEGRGGEGVSCSGPPETEGTTMVVGRGAGAAVVWK